MRAFADHLRSLTGWKLALLLLAAGGLMGWSQAPLNWVVVPFLSFPLLLLTLEGKAGRAVIWRGFLFSFGYFLFGLYWIAHALTVDLHQFWWLLPFAVAGIPFLLSLFHVAGIWLAQRYGGQGLARVVLLAALWSVAEYARGHLLSGFPWLLTGYVWVDVEAVRQIAAFVGAYGLSLWAVLLACLSPWFVPSRREAGFRLAMMAALALPVLALVPLTSAVPEGPAQSLRLRLVQPNMEQRIKLDPAAREADFATLLELTHQPGPVDLVIWPETAVPFRLAERADIRQWIAQNLPENALLVTGAVRREGPDYYNSVQVLNDVGEIVGTYDKSHLVPFGEYIPLRRYLPFDPIAGAGQFSAGPGPQTLQIAGLPSFSPLICYEVIFPGRIVNQQNRAQLLLNVTNDAWYGATHGPYQHLVLARMRAVEEGLPLLRAANTGISAVIDSHGRVVEHLPLDLKGVLNFNLELTATHKTIYASYGDFTVLFSLFVLILVSRLCVLNFKQR